jgi:phosphate transport system ATP-binding protein|nr:phosphate ABC transporter ATP-binding protein [Candidatus Krumholzibacteria bacterium]
MNTSSSTSLRLHHLDVSVGRRQILVDIHLEFEPGRTHVLVGPSGSGKTTLLRAINRLNELFGRYHTKGEVLVPWNGGERLVYADSYPLEQLRRRVGMVFQNPNVLPVSMRRNFIIPLRETLGLRGDEAEHRMRQALVDVGLWNEVGDRLNEAATRLSGGQQQRLCLARALALEPSVLLLDEPTANLDFRAAAGIEDLIGSLKERTVLLVVSHDLDQTVRLADRLVALDAGRVVLDVAEARGLAPETLREQVITCFSDSPS